jgi:hypothetical protein
VAIWIFSLPALIPGFNLANDANGNIGSAIGGITSPIIGLLSTVLLILTLNKQIESIRDQRLRNDTDLIYSLITQMEKELDGMYYKFNEEKTENGVRIRREIRFTGVEALDEFTRKLRYEFDLSKLGFTFRQFFQAHQLLIIIQSFKMIQHRIENSLLPKESKNLFKEKTKSFYICRLHFPLKKLNETMEKYPHFKDELSNELNEFYHLMEEKIHEMPSE